MAPEPRIGIDFDNTIVDYTNLLADAGKKAGYQAAGGDTKTDIRDYIRRHQGEPAWQKVQAEMYGGLIGTAPPYAGVREFLSLARSRGVPVFVVSHKTVFAAADPSGVNLHDAASDWLRQHDLAVDGAFFETSREDKLRRIGALRCTHFIDDLREVLDDPGFPPGVARFLFSPNAPSAVAGGAPYRTIRAWSELTNELFSTAV